MRPTCGCVMTPVNSKPSEHRAQHAFFEYSAALMHPIPSPHLHVGHISDMSRRSEPCGRKWRLPPWWPFAEEVSLQRVHWSTVVEGPKHRSHVHTNRQPESSVMMANFPTLIGLFCNQWRIGRANATIACNNLLIVADPWLTIFFFYFLSFSFCFHFHFLFFSLFIYFLS